MGADPPVCPPPQSTKAVYDRILDLRIATPQIVINYGLFLEEHGYFEESFKVGTLRHPDSRGGDTRDTPGRVLGTPRDIPRPRRVAGRSWGGCWGDHRDPVAREGVRVTVGRVLGTPQGCGRGTPQGPCGQGGCWGHRGHRILGLLMAKQGR